MGYTASSGKKFSSRFVRCVGGAGRSASLLARDKGRTVHGAKLTLISDFLQSIVGRALDEPKARSGLILAAARESRPKSLAEAPRSDLARWAQLSRWRGPPLSDG